MHFLVYFLHPELTYTELGVVEEDKLCPGIGENNLVLLIKYFSLSFINCCYLCHIFKKWKYMPRT